MMYTPHTNITADEFVKREMVIWGEDYIYDLIDRGYTPTLLTDEAGNSKWTWLYAAHVASTATAVNRS